MIYDYPPLHPEIISVFELSWEKRTALSDIRPYDALSIRIKGDTDFVVGEKTYHAEKGDIAYVPAYVQYLHKANRDEHVYVIHFSSNRQSKEIEIFTPKNVALFVDLFQNMHRKCTNKLPGYLFSATATFYKILELMHLQAQDRGSSVMKNFRNAVEYIHLHYANENLTVEQLAELTHVSETYFRNIFYENMGITPLKYINNLRLSLADELLSSRYYSISEIAQLCGFADPKYFSTVYRKARGISPSLVKKNLTTY